MTSAYDHSWRSLYRAGGISGIAFAVPCLAAMALIAIWPPPIDASGAQTLEYIAGHKWLYITEQVLWLAPCLLGLVVFLALTVVARRIDKGYALVAGAIGVSSWALALAVPITGGGSPVLVPLASQYAAATTAEQQTAYATAAEALIAENNTASFVGVLEPLGILLISLLLLRVFPRWVGYLGVATGALGVVSEALRTVIGGAYAVYGTLLLAWFVAAGIVLLRLGRRTALPMAATVERAAA